MSESNRILYMCEVCLTVSESQVIHHDRIMVKCDAGCPGDECTKPVIDDAGHVLTRAPKWWTQRHMSATTHLCST